MNAVATKGMVKRSEGFVFSNTIIIRNPEDHKFLFVSRGKAKLYIRQNNLHHEAIKIADKYVEGWAVGNVNAGTIRILLSDGYHEFKIAEEHAA